MAVLNRQGPPPGVPTDPAYYTWSIQRHLAAIDLSLMLLALIAVLGRLYIRVFVLRVFRLDDHLIVAAMVCSILSCSFFAHVVRLGMGKHIFAIPPESIAPLLKWIFIVAILIPLALSFVKLSIAFFLLSIAQRARYRRFLWSIIVFLVLFMLFTFFSLVFGCVPIAANWNFALRPPPIGTGSARCLSLTTYRNIALVNSIINILTDIVLALMPVPLIWTLQLNKRTKASLIFILSLGFFACAAGIVKTPLLFHFFDDIDSTGNRSWYYAWQITEMNVGIIAATLPSLKPAFRWLLEHAKSLTTGASGNRTGPSHGYKRHMSSGYILQKNGNSNTAVATVGNAGNTKRLDGQAGIEIELDKLEPYNVTIPDDGKSVNGSGRGSDGSSDAILRIDDINEVNIRRIVRTTKITVVTS